MTEKDITAAVTHTVAYLNELVAADPEAMHALVEHRVPCNAVLGAHPSCQVHSTPNYETEGTDLSVGLLGVVNGIFPTFPNGWGRIGASYDENKLTGFKVRVYRAPTSG